MIGVFELFNLPPILKKRKLIILQSSFVKIALLIFTLCISGRQTFTVRYYDCDAPKLLHRYSVSTVCRDEPSVPVDVNLQAWDVLQMREQSESSGFSCRKVITKFWFYCGAYSHMKIIRFPEVEVYESLTVGECRGFVNKKQFQTQDGTIHPLIRGEYFLQWRIIKNFSNACAFSN